MNEKLCNLYNMKSCICSYLEVSMYLCLSRHICLASKDFLVDQVMLLLEDMQEL